MLKKSGAMFDIFPPGIDRLSLTVLENKAHVQKLKFAMFTNRENHKLYDKKCLSALA